MKNVKEINKKYCELFSQTLTMQDAAIVYAIGVTRDGKIAVCMTDDMPPQRIKEILKQTIQNMGG